MPKLIGSRRGETYPVSPGVGRYGATAEIVRFIASLGSQTPGSTNALIPWPGTGVATQATNPIANENQIGFLMQVPEGPLGPGKLIAFEDQTGGDITGDPIPLQWRLLPGPSPSMTFPGVPLGAPRTFVDPSTLTAFPTTTETEFDFSDVIVPAGGGLLYADLFVPANFSVPLNSFIMVNFMVYMP